MLSGGEQIGMDKGHAQLISHPEKMRTTITQEKETQLHVSSSLKMAKEIETRDMGCNAWKI